MEFRGSGFHPELIVELAFGDATQRSQARRADAIEIRMRATRRMDQMRQDQKATVGLAKGTRGNAYGRVAQKPAHDVPTLAEAGIDKNLAHEGRKLGALSQRQAAKALAVSKGTIQNDLGQKVPKSGQKVSTKAERRAEREADWPSRADRPVDNSV